MIYDVERLGEAQMKRSQRYLYAFNAVNGFSYICIGDIVVSLLAIREEFPDWAVATIGCFLYLCYLFMPLGRRAMGRFGAARAQSVFWFFRNVCSLVVASSALWWRLGLQGAAIACVLGGIFGFYLLRALSVVLTTPIIGEICDPEEQPRVISTGTALFNGFCVASLAVIVPIVWRWPSVWLLVGIIGVGASLGIVASRFLAKIDETSKLRESAKGPILQGVRHLWKDRLFRHLTFSWLTSYLAYLLTYPASILLLKKGYGLTDSQALVFSAVRYGASILMSALIVWRSNRLGPRLLVLYSLLSGFGLCLCWIGAPATWNAGTAALATVVFIVSGAMDVVIYACYAHYFLQVTRTEDRVTGSILSNMVSGGGAGVLALLLSGPLLEGLRVFTETPVERYKLYFALVFVLMIPGYILTYRLPPLPKEKRHIVRLWLNHR